MLVWQKYNVILLLPIGWKWRTNGHVVSVASLQNLLAEYELYHAQQERLEQLMRELLLQVPNAVKLLGIKGVGLVTATTFVGKTRDEDPSQIQKLACFNLVENSSGKHKGKMWGEYFFDTSSLDEG